jgi:recombination protein RecA
MEIMFGKGISATGSLLDAALKYNLIQKSGSWYSYGEERVGQGRDNAKQFLEENIDIAEKLESELRKLMFPKPDAEGSQDGDRNGEKAGGARDEGGKKSGATGSSARGSSGTASGGSTSKKKEAAAASASSDDELF